MRWQDMKRDELAAYAAGLQDGRRDALTPEWSCFRDFYMPGRVGILCRVFGTYTQFYIAEKQGESMVLGAWEAIQERMIVQAAMWVARGAAR